MSDVICLKIKNTKKGSQRIIDFLDNRFKYFDVHTWKAKIESGHILVNGKEVSQDQLICWGDIVSYRTTAWKEPAVNTQYHVIYEDEHFLAVSKPSGLPVHSVGRFFQNTLVSLLRAHYPRLNYLNLAHRLDSETSGVVLLCKTHEALRFIQKEWTRGSVHKEYDAFVFGQFHPQVRTICAPIGAKLNGKIRIKQGIDWIRGKMATTIFKAVEIKSTFSWIKAFPITGRTHQIRVQLEAIKFPIIGDKLYSGNDEIFLNFRENGFTDEIEKQVQFSRTALHACRLEFTHPQTQKKIVLEAPIPSEMQKKWESFTS